MNLVVGLLVATAAVVMVACTFIFVWLNEGANRLRKMLVDGKISSIFVIKGKADGKKTWQLRLRASKRNGAEAYYFGHWAHNTINYDEVGELGKAIEPIKGYSAWEIALFARFLSREQEMRFVEMNERNHGADGWHLSLVH